MLHCDIMDSAEYKTLFMNAKLAYPDEYDYILQIACLSYLKDYQIKSVNNIDIKDEIQEEHSTQ